MLDEDFVHTQGSDLDSSIDILNLTQKSSNLDYEFLDSGDEDENAFSVQSYFW